MSIVFCCFIAFFVSSDLAAKISSLRQIFLEIITALFLTDSLCKRQFLFKYFQCFLIFL